MVNELFLLTEQQQRLYATLLTKTNEGKIAWKIPHPPKSSFVKMVNRCLNDISYIFEFDDMGDKYCVTVSRSNYYIAVTLSLKGTVLTSFIAPDDSLFLGAQSHCEKRQEILKRAIRKIDRL